jgi:hypothetical protein
MRLFRRKIKPAKFSQRWDELQKHCASRKTWPAAIIEADALLCEALKKRGYKVKTTGERLVAAQHELTDNEAAWFGHKLRQKVSEENIDVRTLKKKDIVLALAGCRQALRDLGALSNGK